MSSLTQLDFPRAYTFWISNFAIQDSPTVTSFNHALGIFTNGALTSIREITAGSIDFSMFRLLLPQSPYAEVFSTLSPEERILNLLSQRNQAAYNFWNENFLGPDPVDKALFLMALAGTGNSCKEIEEMKGEKVDVRLFNVLCNGPLGKSFR